MKSDLENAIALAVKAHEGQRDKAGMPYVLHPLRIMLKMDSETAMIVAALHDVIEDSEVALSHLSEIGFSEEIVQAVDCVTRRENESYENFVERAQTNPIAKKVKIADLEDNMDLRRLGAITDRDVERLRKYHEIWCRLSGFLNTETKS
jgi:(p)ppGpp synthase/HD superfamily hydrolase